MSFGRFCFLIVKASIFTGCTTALLLRSLTCCLSEQIAIYKQITHSTVLLLISIRFGNNQWSVESSIWISIFNFNKFLSGISLKIKWLIWDHFAEDKVTIKYRTCLNEGLLHKYTKFKIYVRILCMWVIIIFLINMDIYLHFISIRLN